jgi:hypothetical protein
MEDLGNGGLGEWRTWGMEDLGIKKMQMQMHLQEQLGESE